MSVAELVTMIRQAGKIPVERDTLYNVVREWPAEGRRHDQTLPGDRSILAGGFHSAASFRDHRMRDDVG